MCFLLLSHSLVLVFFQRGYTALHLATKEKKTNIVNLLGMLGADANIENEVNVLNY